MVCTVHGFKDVAGDVEGIAEGILDSDPASCDFLNLQIGSLREELLLFELFDVPQRLARALDLLGFLSSLFVATNDRT